MLTMEFLDARISDKWDNIKQEDEQEFLGRKRQEKMEGKEEGKQRKGWKEKRQGPRGGVILISILYWGPTLKITCSKCMPITNTRVSFELGTSWFQPRFGSLLTRPIWPKSFDPSQSSNPWTLETNLSSLIQMKTLVVELDLLIPL